MLFMISMRKVCSIGTNESFPLIWWKKKNIGLRPSTTTAYVVHTQITPCWILEYHNYQKGKSYTVENLLSEVLCYCRRNSTSTYYMSFVESLSSLWNVKKQTNKDTQSKVRKKKKKNKKTLPEMKVVLRYRVVRGVI